MDTQPTSVLIRRRQAPGPHDRKGNHGAVGDRQRELSRIVLANFG
jgi:hypothetical protein